MTRILWFTAGIMLIVATSNAQSQALRIPSPPPAFADIFVSVDGDDEKDPAYKTYTEGYALVLDDKWTDAVKKLAEVKAKFPKSAYVDDAAYWTAYAQKRLDKNKGAAAFEKFITDYPESIYIDDAMAEMTDNVNVVVSPGTTSVRVTKAPGAYTFSHGTSLRESEAAMRQAERAMRNSQHGLRRSGFNFNFKTPRPPGVWSVGGDEREKLDPKTRLKLDALHALSESENDKEAFSALKEVALDKSQPEIMRITALESLGDFRKFEVLPILVDVAKSDASEEIQVVAIHTIADVGSDKNKTVDALVTLFNVFPKQKEKQQQSALYAIADVGNDKAVDFLVKIATTSDNYELRSDAVYYLGNIGNEKSRAALMQILKGK